MKKVIIIILSVIFCIILVVSTVLITLYFYSQNHIMDKGGMMIQDGNNIPKGKVPETEKDRFGDYSLEEWEEMIAQYYSKNLEYIPDEIICYYDFDTFTAKIYDDYAKDTTYFKFDNETHYAESETGQIIDFVNGKEIENFTKYNVNFENNECLAIGYITESNKAEFANKYFENIDDFENLQLYDFRSEYSKENNEGNKFVIIPKSNQVYTSIYSCGLNSEGTDVELKESLLEISSRAYVIYTDYVEVVPNIAITLNYHDTLKTLYLNFSGENGKLILSGCEEEIKDISIY